MSVSDEFLGYLMDQLAGFGNVTSRKMFGGAGLYCDGVMFALVADDVPYLKVDDSNRSRFLAAGSSPFRPYQGKTTAMPYYEIPADIIEDPDQLVQWAYQSLAIQNRGK